ncbi:MAG: S-ribosylhomocysteine lyase [Limnochordia bacterium]|jgi:S-ribosylhomocysteine lyase|nr:S-ribosylhomocysteine lyase [Bacillota bacterium]HOB09103.1 S-ribosylhomocysteine lyase [Limnochordia bacterium]NLH31233.1 S-ribosylhomocysteine lyase [Bacillota bacterium]HPT93147.1 S-ribosylhomocysteine lyase [Limnochordia bacterium]HPZ30045.1 S-ribosylhomocysteine lyase [Limnochordia bacterium]
MDGVVVESFTLDHTKVKAPFVRSCGQIATPKGDLILKFDLRFTQPNVEIMPTNAVHALEHLLAGFMREELDGIVDISPMGCRTGFYLVKVGEATVGQVKDALVNALKKVLQASEVPAANEVQCGNYRDLSLEEAQKYARKVLAAL